MAVAQASGVANAYAGPPPDAVRRTFEHPFFARLLPWLLERAGAGRVVDLGCADGLAARLAGDRLEHYLGIDLCPPPAGSSFAAHVSFLAHDLRSGLGPVGRVPFDLYLATFGLASHLTPIELERLLREITAHARPGAIVALEGLGLYSLEWPGLWHSAPGVARSIPYRLDDDVCVHPWAPAELAQRFEAAGIGWLGAIDRTVQAGPKAGEGRYWAALPRLRAALNALLAGDPEAAGRSPARCRPFPRGPRPRFITGSRWPATPSHTVPAVSSRPRSRARSGRSSRAEAAAAATA